MSKVFSCLLKIALSTLGCFVTNDISLAQVAPDNTLDTRVDRNGNVLGITGGSTQGNNLFHSFQDFSVPTGDTASFNNADAIENIFSRVTGGNISNIDGLIRANGNANLFLINPAGIIFGENARLELGGSFYGSTADSILFESGEFSARDLESPLLTVNAPIGLSFRDEPGEIVNRANFGLRKQTFEQEIDGQLNTVNRITDIIGLEVNPDRNLALIGGNITFTGGGITAPGGNVTLGGLSEVGTVAISPDGFSFPHDVAKANLSLENNALVSVIGNGGGAIDLDVSNLTLSQKSQLRAGIAEGAGDSNILAGDITIKASDSVTLIGNGGFEDGSRRLDLNTGIFNAVGLSPARVENSNNDDLGDTSGSGGSIAIATERLNIIDRAVISTPLYGVGNAGDININADTVTLDEATVTSQVGLRGNKGRGNSGNININSNNFSATNLTFVITDNRGSGTGNAGDININAADSVVIRDTDTTLFISETGVGTVGNAGDLKIAASSIELDNSIELLTQVRGEGNTGAIALLATDLTISGGAAVKAQVLLEEDGTGGEGAGGNITVDVNTFELLDDSQLLASNENIGDAGNITIQADESIFATDRSEITSVIGENAVGNAGDLNITANSLNLENEAELITAIRGRGNTGSIDLNIADSFVLSTQAQIQAQVRSQGEGEAGSIEIDTNTLELLDNSLILADSQSLGNSGDIVIQANESVLVNRSIISTGTIEEAQGSSGEIEIISPQVSLKDRAIISSSAEGSGDTGDIDIDAEIISLDNFSLITASSRTENSRRSGNININGDRLTLTNGSIINATTDSEFDGGQINIDSQVLKLLSGGVLQTATEDNGDAGDIVLNIDDGIFLDGNNAPDRPESFNFDEPILDNLEGKTGIFANVSEDTLSTGGNIKIDSGFIIAFPNGNSDIIANARQGQGGNITINAPLLGIEESSLGKSTNDINASSDNSDLDGSVVIRSLDSDPIAQPRELQSSLIETEQTRSQICQSNRQAAAKNAFTIEGRGGILPTPDSPLDSQNILFSDNSTTLGSSEQPVETSKGKIQVARGIELTKSGEIILTAYRTNNAGERIAEPHNCS